MEIDGKKIQLQIWDPVAQYCTINSEYYKGAAGILLVYDVTNTKSFENLAKWVKNIEENSKPDVQRIISGMNCSTTGHRTRWEFLEISN